MGRLPLRVGDDAQSRRVNPQPLGGRLPLKLDAPATVALLGAVPDDDAAV